MATRGDSQARLSETDAPAKMLPYGRHLVEQDDIDAVTSVLSGEMLAQGPRVAAFERALAGHVGAAHAVACSSGTAALHLAVAALDVGPGDVCVVPAITFLSTATAARFCGAEVVFADVDPHTGLMTPATLEDALRRVPGRVKVALPVHLAGRMCDMPALAEVAAGYGAELVEDASHALGSRAGAHRAGGSAFSRATTFSFHPVKTIACGEGGMVTVADAALAERLRRLRNHGVTREPELLTDAELSLDGDGVPNPWSYEQLELGFNYRMTDLEAALGLSQLGKLDRFVRRRAALAALYDRLLAGLAPLVRPVATPEGQAPSLHLYAVRIDFAAAGVSRAALMRALAAEGIGTQVHYIPLYRQPYLRARCGGRPLPGAEAFYARVLALPLFPAMAEDDVDRVAVALETALAKPLS